MQDELSIHREEVLVDYAQMSTAELEFVRDDIGYITDYAFQQPQGILHADYEARVLGSQNVARDTVDVQGGTIRIAREVRDEEGQIVRSLSFQLADEVSVWDGDTWRAIYLDDSFESYQQFAYMSKIVYETAAQMRRTG